MAKLSTIIFILAVVITAYASPILLERATSSKIVAVKSQTQFCSFLPRTPGQGIGASEDTAIAFCTDTSLADGAKKFPDGFIKSAHFKQGNGFVQVTGRIDRTKYKLKASDGGGQYDVNAPPGAVCTGFKSFVNLVEPDINRYCIRCCQNKSDCPTGKSTQGCEGVIGGDYS